MKNEIQSRPNPTVDSVFGIAWCGVALCPLYDADKQTCMLAGQFAPKGWGKDMPHTPHVCLPVTAELVQFYHEVTAAQVQDDEDETLN